MNPQPLNSDLDFAYHGLQILQAVVDLSPLTVVITDSSGLICYVNPAFEKVSGYKSEEVLGCNPRILKSGMMDDRIYSDLWSQISAGKPWTGRIINRHKDGSIYCEYTTISPLCREDGSIHHFIAMKQDITSELKSAESARHAQDLVNRLAEQSKTVSWEVDQDGLFTHVSQSSTHAWGYQAEDLVGIRKISELIPEMHRSEMKSKFEAAAANKDPFVNFICQIVSGMDELLWFNTNSIPIMDRDGSFLGYSGISMDVTDLKKKEELLLHSLSKLANAVELQKRVENELQISTRRAELLAEKAEAATRAKSEFLAVMSHELRTPLNSVIGFAELLYGYDMDDQQKEAVTAIRESGDHLLNVVNDILDFSGIELGGVISTPTTVSVKEVVDFCSRSILNQVEAKGLNFHCELLPGVPEVISIDNRRIRQILLNLLGNAVKFTDKGSISLTVMPVREGSACYLDFIIEDSGMGIPPEKIELLFQPFSQIDMTHHRQYQGTGLGLVISQRLAHAMGGNITYTSNQGYGSTFTFRLPLPHQDDPTRTSSPAETSGKDESDVHVLPTKMAPVLVVEDDHANGMLASLVLKRLGYTVQVAKNGLEAVHAFASGEFSLILMDLQMPVMDGLKATRTIRNLKIGTRIPIIALTASVLPDDRQRCVESGMDAFIGKPFKIAELEALLNHYTPTHSPIPTKVQPSGFYISEDLSGNTPPCLVGNRHSPITNSKLPA